MFDNEESIDNEENIFNINTVLDELYFSIKDLSDQNNIELIYDMEPNTPREMRGDSEALLALLTKVLRFIFEHTQKDDITLAISSPEDFLYEEFVSFHIPDTQIAYENTYLLFKTDLKKEMTVLGAEVASTDETSTDIHLRIPFKNIELGFRRHYRVPDKEIVGKRVLLLCANDKTQKSIKKMFEYFRYTVDVEIDKLYEDDLEKYDLMIVSEKLPKEVIKKAMYHIQRIATLQYVILQEPKDKQEEATDTKHFIKPITQQKVFDLIVSIFKDELSTEKLAVKKEMESSSKV